MLHEDSDIDEFDKEDKPEDLHACESDASSNENFCDPDDAGSPSNNDCDSESSSSGKYTARN